jgi:uncharacterized protein
MIWLLDGNILTALLIDSHADHEYVKAWFLGMHDAFATCAVTEGTLLRLHMRLAADSSSSTAAWDTLKRFKSHPHHRFIDDGFSYETLQTQFILGRRQVTDAWLAALAKRHGAKLATLDSGLALSHPDVAVLVR